MNKSFPILLVFLFATISLHAQLTDQSNLHSIKLGGMFNQYGSGDLTGVGLRIDHQWDALPWFRIVSGVGMSMASNKILSGSGSFYHASSGTADINLGFSLFRGNNSKVIFYVGASGRYLEEASQQGFRTTQLIDGSLVQIPLPSVSSRIFLYGYSGGVEFEQNIGSRLYFSPMISFQSYNNGDTVLNAGAGLGIRL
ncbi:MAG: hypothetical protein AAF206_07830 [Bacteroidota bacterium]